jgi:hypothetical protein
MQRASARSSPKGLSRVQAISGWSNTLRGGRTRCTEWRVPFHQQPSGGATSATYEAASASNKLWIANETTQNYTEVMDNSTVLNIGEGYVVRMGTPGIVTLDGSAYNTGDVNISGLTRTGTTAAGIEATTL